MIELAIQITLVLLAGAFAVGSVLVYADMKANKTGKFDKQGQVKYTKGDNT
tara:strand:+ start:2119 stop:2271 length:153 start_codon:yes stop_codon:yes gene_type:complete